ncbi:TIGR03987 family protein [Vagococcus coleopterorum]|uniref:TIGR03987 family protein n=1 Tax=Vagococcus coleopterorum TaxID=2714946 RepID=A0A6G8AMR4_9ENTE|nr:HsmA family protein [Vagococcus coleopterorum]QIL46371.1 TIGR03987 family protein [Vagococcus coleopterorum]
MSADLILASGAMIIALISYSIGVFGEKFSGTIQLKHLLFFFGGLIFDTTGTTLMNRIAESNGGGEFGIHQITGGAALILMGFHLLWAIWVYLKGDDKAKEKFHKFSLAVWTLWVISFILGMLVGMGIIG